jgi:hypothetical protein
VGAALLQNLSRNWRRLGPYVLIELLLPGGTLLALLLWLFSGAGRGQFADTPEIVAAPAAIERMVDAYAAA